MNLRYPAQILQSAALLMVLTCCARSQTEEVRDPYKKWLECDLNWAFSEKTVGSDFSLKVSFHGTPVVGTRIALNKAINMSGDGVAATVKTDSRGIARFRAIPKGTYYPDSIDGLLFRSSSLLIKVETAHTSGEKVEVSWPDHSIAVRTLRGKFNMSEELNGPEVALRSVEINLLDLRTARRIESAQTDANGDYEFATRDPGIYALRLTLAKNGEPSSEYRDLAIELDPAAEENSIPGMTLVPSNCTGLQLLRRSESDDSWEAQ
jgi:hypothetical protein